VNVRETLQNFETDARIGQGVIFEFVVRFSLRYSMKVEREEEKKKKREIECVV